MWIHLVHYIYIYIVYVVCTCLHKSCASYIIYMYIYIYYIYILYVYAYVHLAEKHVYTHAMQPAKQTEYIRYGCQSQSPTEIIMQHVFLNINMAVCMYVHSSILHVHRHILHVHTYMCIHRYIDT